MKVLTQHPIVKNRPQVFLMIANIAKNLTACLSYTHTSISWIMQFMFSYFQQIELHHHRYKLLLHTYNIRLYHKQPLFRRLCNYIFGVPPSQRECKNCISESELVPKWESSILSLVVYIVRDLWNFMVILDKIYMYIFKS